MVWTDTRWRARQPSAAPVLDMTPDGQFVDSAAPRGLPFSTKVLGVSVAVAVLAGAIGFALLALWLALQLIPIAIGAGVVAYGVYRFQAWRARQALRNGSLRGQGYPLRRQPGAF